MDFGAHLPLIDFEGNPRTLEHLIEFAAGAEQLGYAALSVNDHLLFPKPWLDGPTALAAVLHATRRIALMTSVALPVVRGPIALAKTLAAIDILSGGRLIVGVGPGSSPLDFAAVNVPFAERWLRLDESVKALRTLWDQGSTPFRGRFYSTDGVSLEPFPPQSSGPRIWIGSWGSDAGLRRVARLADGWLASAYNTTPSAFAAGKKKLNGYLEKNSKAPNQFPNAIATMWTYVTENHSDAERVMGDHITSMINRPEQDLWDQLCIGPADVCAEKLSAYRGAGADRVILWPIVDELRQIELFKERVEPLIA